MTREFTLWIIVAFAVSAPIAGIVMDQWLGNFAYKMGPSWLIYVVAGGAALVIAWATVSFQSWKAARKNPVEVLRYE